MAEKTKAPTAAQKQSRADVQPDIDPSNPTESISSWPPVYEFPDRDPQVLLAFHGLMGFAYNVLGFCEIGMHSKAPQHECMVTISEVLHGGERILFTYNFGLLANGDAPDRIRLDIVEPLPDYTPPRFFMRMDSTYDETDFRHVVDYESAAFYGRKLKLKTSVFKPRLNIRSGLFFTGVVTEEHYSRVAPNDVRYLGPVATVVGAAIFHKPEGYVALRIDKEELKLTPREDTVYLVLFENLCPDNGVPDVLTPNGPVSTDFDLYADTFEIPEDREHYTLVADGDYLRRTFEPVLLEREKPMKVERRQSVDRIQWLNIFEKLRSSRQSPCGEAGFGKTTSGLSGS
jgi:hypothetical protein